MRPSSWFPVGLGLGLAAPAASAQTGGYRLDFGPPLQLVVDRAGPPLAAALVGTEATDEALRLHGEHAHATFGPDARLGVASSESFTIELELRTTASGFATIVMCRDGGTVHFSFVIGRLPGRVSFEPWNWSRERLQSTQRLDDGLWHRLLAAYDAGSGTAVLVVDGVLDATRRLSPFRGSAAPSLRLGENLDPGVHQQFTGDVRTLALQRQVSDHVAAAIALRRAASVLDDTAAAAAAERWLAWQRRPRPPEAVDAAAWQIRAERIRARTQDALGLWPPPYSATEPSVRRGAPGPLDGAAAAATDFAAFEATLPLASRRGGTHRGAGFALTRLWWQTFAGYWAGGWLYEPAAGATEPRPAVLCPHGHWQHGARHPTVQARCIALARLGCVVLAVDSVHFEDARLGLSSLSVMTWNNLRALALLRGRSDVDPHRIACTGASGGGQQTYYLTALQTELCAAVPAVMAAHFEDILLADQVHCRCNHTPHLLRAADMPEMAAAFAPRPQLFLTVTGDWTRRFAEHGFPGVQRVYALLGAADAVAVRRWQKNHDYDRPMREAMYAFLWPVLTGNQLVEGEVEAGLPAPLDLAAFAALDHDRPPQDPAAVRAEFVARLAVPTDRPAAEAREALARLFARAAGDGQAPPPDRPLRRLGEIEIDGLTAERLAIPADRFVDLPALWLAPARAGAPVVVVVGEGGKAAVLARQRPSLERLRARGLGVLLADVRHTGELDHGRDWRELYGRMFGADEGVLAVWDLQRLVAAAETLGGGSPVPVGVLAFGDRGAVGLIAAALDARIAAVAAPQLGPGYREVDRTPPISRILLHGDLDDAVRCLAGRPLLADAAALAAAL